MFLRLVALFVSVPLLELMLLVWVGRRVGVLPTVGLVVVTGILGASLARHQGLATWRRFSGALGRGELPTRELVEGILILVAGAVLLTPGLLTDALGFSLLVPWLRGRAARRLEAWASSRVRVVGAGGAGARTDDGSLDVEYTVEE